MDAVSIMQRVLQVQLGSATSFSVTQMLTLLEFW